MTSIRVEINSSWEDDNFPFLSIPNSTSIVNVRCFIYRNKLAEETVVNSAAILVLSLWGNATKRGLWQGDRKGSPLL